VNLRWEGQLEEAKDLIQHLKRGYRGVEGEMVVVESFEIGETRGCASEVGPGGATIMIASPRLSLGS
jgi:hypothetical protein